MAVQKITYAIPAYWAWVVLCKPGSQAWWVDGMCSIAGHYLRLSTNRLLFPGLHMRGLVSFGGWRKPHTQILSGRFVPLRLRNRSS